MVLSLMLLNSSCEGVLEDIGLKDVKIIEGSCTITLSDGSIVTSEGLEIMLKTETITYRDEEGKLWSFFKNDYQSYSCQ